MLSTSDSTSEVDLCPLCDGPGCEACENAGTVSRERANEIEDEINRGDWDHLG